MFVDDLKISCEFASDTAMMINNQQKEIEILTNWNITCASRAHATAALVGFVGKNLYTCDLFISIMDTMSAFVWYIWGEERSYHFEYEEFNVVLSRRSERGLIWVSVVSLQC